MLVFDHHAAADQQGVEDLLDRAFGAGRLQKPAQALREGQMPARGLAFLVRDHALPWGSRIVGTLTFWNVLAGPATRALLLGPLAVDPDYQGTGIGRALMLRGLDQARQLGHGAVVLVGDPAYYKRFGFSKAPVARLVMPGDGDERRFLGRELVPGALAQATGFMRPAVRLPSSLMAQAA